MVTFLLLQNYTSAQVATWLTSGYSYGTTLLCNQFSIEGEGAWRHHNPALRWDTPTGQLHGRMEDDGQEVCLRLGPMGKPHSLFITPGSLV